MFSDVEVYISLLFGGGGRMMERKESSRHRTNSCAFEDILKYMLQYLVADKVPQSSRKHKYKVVVCFVF